LKKFREKVTEGANWITIIFSMILYTAIGVMEFSGGSVTLRDFSNYTWLDWVVWVIITFIPAILAIVVSTAFGLEGLKQGKERIREVIEKYQELLAEDVHVKRRSEKEFLTQGILRKTLRTFTMTLVLSFIAGQLIINFNADGVCRLIINISTWLVFGISSYSAHYEYATTELKEWYLIEIGRLKTDVTEEKTYEEQLKC
jgi:hypothetical protein